jgi:hypothetical protein
MRLNRFERIFVSKGIKASDIELTSIGKISILGFMFFLLWLFQYQRTYYMNSDGNTATKGIFFQDTYDLSKYVEIGEGNKLICGKTVIYTRSAIHQTIEVCK